MAPGVDGFVEVHLQGSQVRESGSVVGYFYLGLANVVLALLEGSEHEEVNGFEDALVVLAADRDIVIVDIHLDWHRDGGYLGPDCFLR